MTKPVENNQNTTAATDNLPAVSSAFGDDRNQYAYPSSKGMSGLGVASAICALCSFFLPILVFVSTGLGIAGLVRRRSDVLCWIGLVLSVIFLVYNIIVLAQFCGSPFMQEMLAGMM